MTLQLYGFRKNGELVREVDSSHTFFRTYDAAAAHLTRGEQVVIVTVKIPREAK